MYQLIQIYTLLFLFVQVFAEYISIFPGDNTTLEIIDQEVYNNNGKHHPGSFGNGCSFYFANTIYFYGGSYYSTKSDIWSINKTKLEDLYTLEFSQDDHSIYFPGKLMGHHCLVHRFFLDNDTIDESMDETLYVYSGYDGNELNNRFYSLKLQKDEMVWNFTQIGNYPTKKAYVPSIIGIDKGNYPGARRNGMFILISEDLLLLYAGYGYNLAQISLLSDLWLYNITSGEWKAQIEPGLLESKTENCGNRYTEGGTTPGSRSSFSYWADPIKYNKEIYIFGGYGNGCYNTDNHFLNELWKMTFYEGEIKFRFISGSPVQYDLYSKTEYGESRPGARYGSLSFIGNNYLFLFSGYGYGTSVEGVIQDLWGFSTIFEKWTFLGGAKNPVEEPIETLPLPRYKSFHFNMFENNKTIVFGSGGYYGSEWTKLIRDSFSFVLDSIYCFGKDQSENDVCSGKGSCIYYDKCVCDSSNETMYDPSDCSFSCFGIEFDQSDVCGGHGECVDYNECECYDTNSYSGEDCSILMCPMNSTHFVTSEDPRVCSGTGMTCTTPYSCDCGTQYSGVACECGECVHGECINSQCECEKNDEGLYLYVGEKCNQYNCFHDDTYSEEDVSCNDNGICLGARNCNCYDNDILGHYSGEFCEKCHPSYVNYPLCDTPYCNASKTCNGRGECNELNCECSGNFTGKNCETCKEGFIGENCDVICSDEDTCNGNGLCNSNYNSEDNLICECYKREGNSIISTNQAFFFDPYENCGVCLENYYGSQCNIEVDPLSQPLFSLKLDKIKGIGIKIHGYSHNTIACSKLFKHSTLTKLGKFPVCRWETLKDNRTLTIILGDGFSLKSGDLIEYDFSNFDASIVPESHIIGGGELVDIFDFSLDGTDEIGPCSVLQIMASFDKEFGSMEFEWTSNNPNLNSQFDFGSVSTESLSISSDLIPNGTIIFSLNVKLQVLGIEVKRNISIIKTNEFLPIIGISGKRVRNIRVNSELTLEAILQMDYSSVGNCISRIDITEYNIMWNIISGPISISYVYYGKILHIKKGVIRVAGEYVLQASLVSIVDGFISTTHVRVIVESGDLVAYIKGGSREYPKTVLNALDQMVIEPYVFDGDNSNEVEYFLWECKTSSQDECFEGLNGTLISSKNLRIPSSVLKILNGTYYLTFYYMKGERYATDSIEFSVVDKIKATILVNRKPEVVFPDASSAMIFKAIPLTSQVNEFYNNENYKLYNLKFLWEVLDNEKIALNKTNCMTPVDSDILVLKKNTFQHSTNYEIKVTVLNFNDEIVGESSISFLTNDKPRNGLCSIYPKEGEAWTTYFKFECSSFVDDHLPLSYLFGYIDKSGAKTYMRRKSADPSVRVYLPPGNITLFAEILDYYNSSTTIYEKVTVNPKEVSEEGLNTFLEKQILMNAGNYYSMLVGLQSSCEYLDNIKTNLTQEKRNITASLNTKKEILQLLETMSTDNTTYEIITENVDSVRNKIRIFETLSNFESAELLETVDSVEEINNEVFRIIQEIMIQSFLDDDSDLLSSALKIFSNIFDSSTEDALLEKSKELYENTRELTKNIVENQVRGSDPTIIEYDEIKALVSKKLKNQLSGSYSFSDSNITIPDVISDYFDISEISIVVNVFKKDPHIEGSMNFSKNKNISMPGVVVSLEFHDENSSILEVNNLTDYIFIEILGTYNLSEVIYSKNSSKKGWVPQCRWWNEVNNSWDNEGCHLVSLMEDKMICACVHATDFSAILEYFEPDLTILTPEDFINITKLSQDNYLTLLVVCIMAITYLLLIIFVEVVEMLRLRVSRKIFDVAQVKMKNLAKEEEKGNAAPPHLQNIVRKFLGEHKYFSIFFPLKHQVHFTTTQRITIIYVSFIGSMMSNALTFNSNPDQIYQFLISTIVANLMTAPFSVLFTFLFMKSSPRLICKGSKVDGERNRKDQEMKKQEFFEDESLRDFSEEECLRDFSEEECLRDFSEEDSSDDYVKKEVKVKKNQELNEINSQIKNERDSFPDLGPDDNPTKAIVEKVKNGYIDEKKELSGLEKTVAKCNKLLDKAYFYLKDITMKFTWYGAAVFVLSTILYIIVIMGIAVWTYFGLTWGESGSVGWSAVYFTVIIAILAYVGTIEVVFLLTKARKYANTEKMSWISQNKTILIIQIIVCAFVFIVSVLSLIGMIVCIFVIDNFPLDIGVSLSLLFVGFACFTFIWGVLMLRKPKKRKGNKKKIKVFLPFWVKYVSFVCCWIYIAVSSYLLVLYGIKFDSTDSTEGVSRKWLIGSGTSVVEDFFLQEPIEIIIKTVVLVSIMNMFEMLFFRSSDNSEIEEKK